MKIKKSSASIKATWSLSVFVFFMALFSFSLFSSDIALAVPNNYTCTDPTYYEPSFWNQFGGWSVTTCTGSVDYSPSLSYHDPSSTMIFHHSVTTNLERLPQFWYQVSTDTSFSNLVVNTGYVPQYDKTYYPFSASLFSPSTNYYWRFSYQYNDKDAHPICTMWTPYGSFTTLPPAASCTLPWGGSIAHNASVTAYQATSVSCASSCASVSQTRNCTNGVLSGTYTNQNCSVAACPSVTLTASPNPVAFNGASTLTWTTSNATSCWASGAWTGWVSNTGGTQSTGPLAASQTYSIECWNAKGDSTGVKTVTVSLLGVPTVNISASPPSVSFNGSSTISWNTTNATSCLSSWGGAVGLSGSFTTGNLTTDQTYTLTCSGPGGSGSSSVTITVGACGPICVNNSNVCAGTPYDGGCGMGIPCWGNKNCCDHSCTCAASTCKGAICANDCGESCSGTKNCSWQEVPQ
jgi:hypothetical protein